MRQKREMQVQQAYLMLSKPGLCKISRRVITIPALQGQLLAFPALHRSSSRCSRCSFSNSNSPWRLPLLPVRTYPAKAFYQRKDNSFQNRLHNCCVHAHSSLLMDCSEITIVVVICWAFKCCLSSVWRLTYADADNMFLNQAMQQQAQQVQQLQQAQAHL